MKGNLRWHLAPAVRADGFAGVKMGLAGLDLRRWRWAVRSPLGEGREGGKREEEERGFPGCRHGATDISSRGRFWRGNFSSKC